MDATRNRLEWAGRGLAGLALLIVTLLLLWVGAWLTSAANSVLPQWNGVQVSSETLVIAAVGLLAVAFVLGVLAYGEAYGATLWATAPFLPGVAAAAVLLAYLGLPGTGGGLPHGTALFLGTWTALVVWIVSGGPLRWLSNVATAQAYSYGWLKQRTEKLDSQIAKLADAAAGGPERAAALAEASDYLKTLKSELGIDDSDPKSGFRYVSADGYVELWRLVHRAEELLLGLDTDLAVGAALYDDLRLENSTIPNRDHLRAQIKMAVTVLNPDAAGYLQEQASPPATPPPPKAEGQAQAERQKLALTVIRTTRQALNESRDGEWHGIARARNRLLRTSLFAGAVAFMLLGLALVGSPENLFVGASAFYLVGALVGLFARLRAEGQSHTASDDYGLFEARLLQIPLLSGLAAVGGVFLVAVGTPILAPHATGAAVTTVQFGDIFNISKNSIGLLSAAVFGLTPELLLKELQSYGNKRLENLDSSQATGAGGSTSPKVAG